MKWYEPLYVGERVKKREQRIRNRLDAGKTDLDHYLITFAAFGNDQLDVFSTSYLMQDPVRDTLPMVVGLAEDKAEAMGLVMQITKDCVRETGGGDIRAWLTEKSQG